MNTSISVSTDAVRGLSSALLSFDPTDFVAQLTELASDYTFALNSIANGYGNTERPANEDPAQELARLREAFAPNMDRINSLFYFVNAFAALMAAVNRVDWECSQKTNQ